MIGDGRPLHVEVFGLWRNYYARINAGAGNARRRGRLVRSIRTSAVGASAAASSTACCPGTLDLQGSILKGRGIGRYGSANCPT